MCFSFLVDDLCCLMVSKKEKEHSKHDLTDIAIQGIIMLLGKKIVHSNNNNNKMVVFPMAINNNLMYHLHSNYQLQDNHNQINLAHSMVMITYHHHNINNKHKHQE